nr:acyl-CoA dehydrogenase family protein [Gordonia neofelifaecis]
MMDSVLAERRDRHRATTGFDRALWDELDELGLVRLTAPESTGGSGAGWAEAAELLTAAVRHAIRLPLAEHDLLACDLLTTLNLRSDDGLVRTMAVVDSAGRARSVPWADDADRIIVIGESAGRTTITDVDRGACTLAPGVNQIGEPRSDLVVDLEAADSHEVPAEVVRRLRLKHALVRAIQVCAALDCAVESAIEHATARVQFGRPLAKMQAVQTLIADAAAEAALARTATETALAVAVDSGWSDRRLGFLIAVARSCSGHAASMVVRNAHQIHGAIGTTLEHRLHEFTRAALAWRGEGGSVAHWDREVARAAVEAGEQGVWALITG